MSSFRFPVSKFKSVEFAIIINKDEQKRWSFIMTFSFVLFRRRNRWSLISPFLTGIVPIWPCVVYCHNQWSVEPFGLRACGPARHVILLKRWKSWPIYPQCPYTSQYWPICIYNVHIHLTTGQYISTMSIYISATPLKQHGPIGQD